MTLRTLLAKLLERENAPVALDWINVRCDDYPWRHLVAAGERGELTVARVGRKLLVRRPDLDRWLESRAIRRRASPSSLPEALPVDRVGHLLEAAGYSRKAR